jgi:hypothetical protein
MFPRPLRVQVSAEYPCNPDDRSRRHFFAFFAISCGYSSLSDLSAVGISAFFAPFRRYFLRGCLSPGSLHSLILSHGYL